MRLRGAGWVKRQAARAINFALPFGRSAAVLMYHRIAEHVPDPQLLCVKKASFAQHLDYLRRHCRIISLSQLVDGIQCGRLPRRGVVITFDDGYADNLWNAKPLLEQASAPATVFVTTDYVGQPSEQMQDELERLILLSPSLPATLTVTIDGRAHEWDLAGGEKIGTGTANGARSQVFGGQLTGPDIGPDSKPFEALKAKSDSRPCKLSPENPENWNVTMKSYPTARHRCYREVHDLLRPMGPAGRRQAMEAIRRAIPDALPQRDDRRIMNADELKALAEGGLIEIGAHTMSHPQLSLLPVEEQYREVRGSKEALEKILGREVPAFAYPYGGAGAVDVQTIDCVRRAGFRTACATVPGLVRPGQDCMVLPRFVVRDWPRREFARRLRSFFGE